MKTLSLFVFGLFFMTVSFSSVAQDKKIPTIELKTLESQVVNLKDYIKEGEITFISFWATWCSPCKKELDNLMKLVPNWKKQGHKVNIIAVSMDNSRTASKVKGVVESKGWSEYYTVLCDVDNVSYQKLSFQTVPQSFLINQNGSIVESHSGYTEGYEVELSKKIAQLSD